MVNPDAPEPVRRTYGLKRSDPLAQEAPGTRPPRILTVQEMTKMAGAHHDPGPRTASAKPGDPNDVFTVRQELRTRERADGRDQIVVPKKKSRRKRDYWLVMIGANLLFAGVAVAGRGNVVILVYCGAGMILVSVATTWIMWFLLSDY